MREPCGVVSVYAGTPGMVLAAARALKLTTWPAAETASTAPRRSKGAGEELAEIWPFALSVHSSDLRAGSRRTRRMRPVIPGKRVAVDIAQHGDKGSGQQAAGQARLLIARNDGEPGLKKLRRMK